MGLEGRSVVFSECDRMTDESGGDLVKSIGAYIYTRS